MYTEWYKILYSQDNIDFTVDTTLATPISGNKIQYKIPFHIQNLKTYDQKVIQDTTNDYSDITSYNVTINNTEGLFLGTQVSVTINNVDDISNIEIDILSIIDMTFSASGQLASGVFYISGDTTTNPTSIAKTITGSNSRAEIYKLDESNVATELLSDINLDISDVSISNIDEDDRILLLFTRNIDPDVTEIVDTTASIIYWGSKTQDDVVNYTTAESLEQILNIFNNQLDFTYTNDFSDTSTTHVLLTESSGTVAKISFSSFENSLYRTKKLIFNNNSDLSTVVQVIDGDGTMIYDVTTNDNTSMIPITNLSDGKCKIYVKILDFVEGETYNIDFSLSLSQFFDNKYSASDVINKLYEIPDSTETIDWSPETSMIFFGGLSST